MPVHTCALCSCECCSCCPCPCPTTSSYPSPETSPSSHIYSTIPTIQFLGTKGKQKPPKQSSASFGTALLSLRTSLSTLLPQARTVPVCSHNSILGFSSLQLTRWVHPAKIPLVLFISLITPASDRWGCQLKGGGQDGRAAF